MESKNVKIIDEHGIDREASIICSIDVDGSDYVVYWIERDSENDNIFVSKILKNNDGTSNMVNIEDAGEKSRVSDIVKGIITYAINNEADKLVGASVTLPNGHNVGISSVLINKEQNINVQKTYITTVKKSVTKVSETFYVVEKPEIVEPVVLPIFEDVVAPAEVVEVKDEVATIQPVVSTPVEVVSESETIVPEVKVETPTLEVSQPEVSVLHAGEEVTDGNITIKGTHTHHGDPTCVGFNIKYNNFSLSYTADTEYFPELHKDHEGADVLIGCVIKEGERRIKGHLRTIDFEQLIEEVQPKLAIMTHLGVNLIMNNPFQNTRIISNNTGIRTIAATDGLSIDLDQFLES